MTFIRYELYVVSHSWCIIRKQPEKNVVSATIARFKCQSRANRGPLLTVINFNPNMDT